MRLRALGQRVGGFMGGWAKGVRLGLADYNDAKHRLQQSSRESERFD